MDIYGKKEKTDDDKIGIGSMRMHSGGSTPHFLHCAAQKKRWCTPDFFYLSVAAAAT